MTSLQDTFIFEKEPEPVCSKPQVEIPGGSLRLSAMNGLNRPKKSTEKEHMSLNGLGRVWRACFPMVL